MMLKHVALAVLLALSSCSVLKDIVWPTTVKCLTTPAAGLVEKVQKIVEADGLGNVFSPATVDALEDVARTLGFRPLMVGSVQEGEGSLLDNCMVVYGAAIGDGNRHNHDNLPVLLAGKGGGTLTPGRHVRYEFDTPMTNLFLSMLERMGVQEKQFGDSTGPLEGLA